jgi:predicted nucleic acid-binding OB-fold protein
MRGTEEALIEIPYSSEMLESVVKDLEYIKARVEEHGVSLSAVVILDYVPAKPARSRREAYHGTPGEDVLGKSFVVLREKVEEK